MYMYNMYMYICLSLSLSLSLRLHLRSYLRKIDTCGLNKTPSEHLKSHSDR